MAHKITTLHPEVVEAILRIAELELNTNDIKVIPDLIRGVAGSSNPQILSAFLTNVSLCTLVAEEMGIAWVMTKIVDLDGGMTKIGDLNIVDFDGFDVFRKERKEITCL